MSPSSRMSAEQRRDHVIRAAQMEFGRFGYDGASTAAIAKRVGVSQPYLFRLFPSKKAIFLVTIDVCFDDLEKMFEAAAGDLTGEEALAAMGRAYNELLDEREKLQMQLQTWATACHDEEIRAKTRQRWGRLWQLVERLSGADQQRVIQFLAGGMLLNVFAALELPRIKEQLGEALTGLAGPPGD
jgi:AcrR family transcriptional regulator